MREALAPGKVVLTGEYAVLCDAPALVVAVNRYVRGTLTALPPPGDAWQFRSLGFEGQSSHDLMALRTPRTLPPEDPARLWAFALATALNTGGADIAPHECVLDTSAMYSATGRKFGLGSSAAAIVVCCGLLHGADKAISFKTAHDAHCASQDGVGSGLDIASALQGGLIRFQQGASSPCLWPDSLHYRFVDTGVAASTPPLIRRFEAWRKGGIPSELGMLIDAATTLADGALNLDNLARYAAALDSMDQAAGIGIYSAEHRACQQIAEANGVVYKPCGAGGGDLGIAISDEPDQLDRFARGISHNYATIDLGMAQHGLIVR